MAEESPIFIVGTERSGSNLLRLILNEHPSIAIPHPPHILKEFAPLEARYGDLDYDPNFRNLVDDVVRLVELHFAPWDVAVDRKAVFAGAPRRDLYGVMAAVYDQYRLAKGKKRWGCKSTFVIDYADKVLMTHPKAKFIHLVRDGRDVAVSAKKSVFNHFHPYYVGRLWARQQAEAAALSGRLSAERFMTLRYEDLLDDPRTSTRAVCRFIGEDYSDSLLRYFEGAEAKSLAGRSRSWENVARPVLGGNKSKYKSALSAAEIAVFERQAHGELERFGYALENAGPWREETTAELARYWLGERMSGDWVAFRSLFEDENALLRLRRRLFLMKTALLLGAWRRA